MGKQSDRVGLWLIGARGGVATTAIVGLEAVRRRLAEPVGLLGHLPPFNRIGLIPLDNWVVGGHEIRDTTLEDAGRELREGTGLFPAELLAECRGWLRTCDRHIRPGTTINCGRAIAAMASRRTTFTASSGAACVERLADDIRRFQRSQRLARVVVLNVASTEPPLKLRPVHRTWAALEKGLARKNAVPLPAGCLYALAAIEAGASYVNFTPSSGINIPALRERADARGIAYMGADGKTGETLMKSVLAPMFAARNLQVLSWVGHNIFGNRDAVVLDNPANKAAKVRSKDHLVSQMLGYSPQTLVSIEYIKSMQDWKTAWDHIHFAGFLGTKMSLQFIWQGCDSALAAPLAIELARFAELASRRGEAGPLKHLACFFKSPIDVTEQGFARQNEALLDYVRALPSRAVGRVRE